MSSTTQVGLTDLVDMLPKDGITISECPIEDNALAQHVQTSCFWWTSRRKAAILVCGAVVLAVCSALAILTASAVVKSDAEDLGDAVFASAGPRRASESGAFLDIRATAGKCRNVQQGEVCFRHVKWSMDHGIVEHQDWYAGLDSTSSFDEFQVALHEDSSALCPLPCNETAINAVRAARASAEKAKAPLPSDQTLTSNILGYEHSDHVVGQGWCSVSEPKQGWKLESCSRAGTSLEVKVLTYNLFWWNLFTLRGGNNGSAGALIGSAGAQHRFDVMGFQECEGVKWVLQDAGLAHEYGALAGPHALCMAYRKSEWNLLADGATDVGEDRSDQWYGTRAAMWARFEHRSTGKVFMFVNHHGPLPVNSGGKCGGEATAYNLLKLMATHGHVDDSIALVGDFNAAPQADTPKNLRGRLHSVFTGTAFGGVDQIWSSCSEVVGTRNLGSGGSDHDALEAILRI